MKTAQIKIKPQSALFEQLKSLRVNCNYDGHHTYIGNISYPPGQTFSVDDIKVVLGCSFNTEIDNRLHRKLDLGLLENTTHSLGNPFVDQVLVKHDDSGAQYLTVTGYSPSIFLDCAPHFQAFSDKTLYDIAEALLGEGSCPYLIAPKARNYHFDWVIQCQETIYNLLKRLCAQTGELECFFDGEQLVIDDLTNSTAKVLIQLKEGDNLSNLKISFDTSPQTFKVEAYDYINDRMLDARSKATRSCSELINLVLKASNIYPKQRIFSPFSMANEQSIKAIGHRLSAAQSDGLIVVSGSSMEASLKVGTQLQVESSLLDGALNNQLLTVISVNHNYQQPGMYSNSFTAIPSSLPFNLPMSYNKPNTGPLAAVVKEVKGDPKSLGRVRVWLVGDPNQSISPWIRLLQPFTGGGGWYTPPKTGDHVMIMGEQFNPECSPVVLGSYYTGSRDASFWKGKDGGVKHGDFECSTKNGNLKIEAGQFEILLDQMFKLTASFVKMFKNKM